MYQETKLQTIHFGDHSIELLVPNQEEVKRVYKSLSEKETSTPFPYWTQVWPSAIAMAQFICEKPHYFIGKHVTELAAGLGLPSFVIAQFAKNVYCTDYLQDAVNLMEESVKYTGIKNIACGIIDWNNIPTDFPQSDIILMSDINYNPTDFEILYNVFTRFIALNCTIILTTPQRLLAKPFIERLMPFCSYSEERNVHHLGNEVSISVLVLSKRL